MSNDTLRLQLPLIQAAQAQKHVTVNESLMRLDGMVNLVLNSVTVTAPPDGVIDGQCWAVPVGASGDWSGKAGQIAIGSNGGWAYLAPQPGMRAFIADQGVGAIFDGADWAIGALTLGQGGSGMIAALAEGDVTITPGATVRTGVMIPAGAMVIGAVARVTTAITGSAATWRMGTEDGTDRFGNGLGKARQSWARGMLGSPMTYYAPSELILTAEGGTFTAGQVKVAVHWWEMRLPQ
ncbi:DUF2793 domain-containing protein [Paracoccus sp. (in: a-proteobacteria)]|uniref:DUF2793 domain-containing protein n=1 Tax=Paracoccus sp. TaxID=267 RepID=UPI0026E0BE6C|nr:DUF2793 domain-containing protein [Paracoccus sp. (in: a-proteobacteria)]MDO5647993.1 DUF2793 domain-containing protein [Paracoccus sp. (in: a-proteobacteria)]